MRPQFTGLAGTFSSARVGIKLGGPDLVLEHFTLTDPSRDVVLLPPLQVLDYLTNGWDDSFAMVGFLAGGLDFGGGLEPESMVFAGSSGLNGIDFLGSSIDRIEVHIENPLAVPGSDLNHDGQWIDFNLDLTIKVYGTAVPEPSTYSMLLAGLLGLVVAGRRKATR